MAERVAGNTINPSSAGNKKATRESCPGSLCFSAIEVFPTQWLGEEKLGKICHA
jgi:hypothetical protein